MPLPAHAIQTASNGSNLTTPAFWPPPPVFHEATLQHVRPGKGALPRQTPPAHDIGAFHQTNCGMNRLAEVVHDTLCWITVRCTARLMLQVRSSVVMKPCEQNLWNNTPRAGSPIACGMVPNHILACCPAGWTDRGSMDGPSGQWGAHCCCSSQVRLLLVGAPGCAPPRRCAAQVYRYVMRRASRQPAPVLHIQHCR